MIGQQNPFNTQEKRTRWSETLHMPRLHGFVSDGVLGRIPIRTSKSVEPSDDLPWQRDAQQQQDPFLSTLEQVAVIFPRTSRITINEEGVFVPKIVFGDDANVRAEVSRSYNRVRVVLSSETHAAATTGVKARYVIEPVDRTRELCWIEEHREEYAGQWVALDGERLLGHGENAREVYLAARAEGVARPFVMRVESEEPLPFGGW